VPPEGGRVVVGDVPDDDGATVVSQPGEKRARFVHLDVTDGAEWHEAVASAESAFGPVSLLVNNAAIVRWGPPRTYCRDRNERAVTTDAVTQWLSGKSQVLECVWGQG
jgi:3alpha(or 20beta)-hydroxysteroid dehydrogenase